MTTIKIGPGEHYVTRNPSTVIVTVLGSCVAACIRDPLAGIGGMNHFMLPESATGVWGAVSANMRYGNFAMETLVNDILRLGGMRSRLETKVFGGGSMINGIMPIGHQNADFVEAYLASENMPLAGKHLRGEHARRVEYTPGSGKVRMLELLTGLEPVALAEKSFLKGLREHQDSGTIELFD